MWLEVKVPCTEFPSNKRDQGLATPWWRCAGFDVSSHVYNQQASPKIGDFKALPAGVEKPALGFQSIGVTKD